MGNHLDFGLKMAHRGNTGSYPCESLCPPVFHFKTEIEIVTHNERFKPCCFNEKLGEITFQNKPSEFGKLITKCKKYCTDGKGIVFALENSYGYGRALAAWLIERDYIVKDVNPALSYAYRKSVPQYKKNDSYDAQCVARVAINELNKLPDAMPEDMYWTLSQLVNRRANLKTHHIRLKNQLHEQVCVDIQAISNYFRTLAEQQHFTFGSIIRLRGC